MQSSSLLKHVYNAPVSSQKGGPARWERCIADLILYVNFVHLQRNNIQIIAHAFDNIRQRKNQVYTRNTCMQQPLALVSKQLYFPNMKYLKIVVIFTLSIFLQKNEKIMSFNYKIYNLPSFLVSNTINVLL